MFVCVPMASMVTRHPCRAHCWKNRGIAVCLFCGDVRQHHAMTRGSAFLPVPRSCERCSVLPSRATTPLIVVLIPCTHGTQLASHCVGSIGAHWSCPVSWEGLPWGPRLRSLSRMLPIPAHFSAPQLATMILSRPARDGVWFVPCKGLPRAHRDVPDRADRSLPSHGLQLFWPLFSPPRHSLSC